MNCTNQQPPQRGGAVPNPVWVGLKWLLVFPRVPVTPGTPLIQTIFWLCSPLNHRKRVARSLFKIGLSSFFSCLSLARLLILLLLISANVHPNPCPVFPCSVCAGNVTWRGIPAQCCTCSNRVHFKCSLLSFSRFTTLGSSHSWSVPAFFGDSTPTSTVPSFSDSSSWYTSTASSGPFLLMQHSHPTLAFKPLILYPLNLYLLPLHPHHRLMLLAVSLYLLFPLLPNSLRLINGILGVSEPGTLKWYTLFSLIPLTLFVSRNLTLIYLPLFRSLDSLLCDSMAPTPDLVFFLLMSQTLAAASSLSSGRVYPSMSFLPPLFLRLAPNLIM